MSRASNRLVAKNDGNAITVVCQYSGNKMKIGGSSLLISAQPNDSVTFFSVKVPEKGKQGIVALNIEHLEGSGKNESWCRESHILAVYNPIEAGKNPYIDLDGIWVPPCADRLMQINYWGKLEVKIDGIVYTTEKPCENSETSDCYVPDANLLCKYVLGIVSAKEVKAHAESYVQEISAKKKLPKLEQELVAWKQSALKLKKATSSLIFKGADVKEALKGFPSES